MALRDFFLNQSVNEMFPNRLPGTAKGWDESSVNREVILDPDVPVTTEVLPSMAVKLSGRQGQMFWVEPCTTVADEVFGFVIYKAKNVINRITRNQMATVARHMQLMDFVFKTAVTAGQAVYQDPVDHYCTTNSADGVYVGVAMETIPATATFPTIATVEIQLAAGVSAEGGVTEEWVKNNFINADASTYAIETLDELFSNSNAKLAKVYNEPKMPAMGSFTVLSLGWTYTDSENEPTLLATDLETGEFYYYHGSLADCAPDAWQQFSFGGGSGESGLPSQTGHTGFLQTNGTTASWSDKEALVNQSSDATGLAIGRNTKSGNQSVALGSNASTGLSSNAIAIGGYGATAADKSIAIGANARAASESIALGTWVNNTTARTLKVGFGFDAGQTLLNSDYTIPSGRLAADGTSGQVLSKTDTGMAWIDIPSVTSTTAGDDGLRGDYCCRYGVTKWPNGAPTIGTGNTVAVPAGLVLNVPGTVANPSTSLITLASAQTATLTKTTNSLLVYIQGLDELVQCDKICFTRTTPVDDDSTCQLWWNGEEMKFRSTDQGNVWIAVRAAVLGELIYTDGSLTRINRTGWYHYLPDSTPTE